MKSVLARSWLVSRAMASMANARFCALVTAFTLLGVTATPSEAFAECTYTSNIKINKNIKYGSTLEIAVEYFINKKYSTRFTRIRGRKYRYL